MEYAILILSLVLGSIYRRMKGGWCNINSTVLRVSGFLTPLSICLLCGFPAVLSVVLSSFVTFGWLMPYHGYGMGMGFDGNRKTWECILVMLAQYGGVTLLAGIAWELIQPHSGGLYYAPMGCIIWLGYYLSWFVCKRFDIKPTSFTDSPTCYGELILGAVLVGGIPLAHILAG